MSIQIFSQFNIDAGFTTRDTTADIRRAELVSACEDTGGMLVRPRQVHGKDIAAVNKISGSYLEIPDTDGCITDVPGVTLTSSHGDCLAVYAYDKRTGAVGLAHAGWKGTLLGIAREMITAMNSEYDSDPSDISCYISPGISKCCFEVSHDVYDQFINDLPWSKDFIVSKGNGKYLIDLKGINEKWLSDAGVKEIEISSLCTCCEKDMFFSYRRDKDAERMLAWIKCK